MIVSSIHHNYASLFAALLVDFKVLGVSPRLLPLDESPYSGPQVSIRVMGLSVGRLYFHVSPLTYDEYEARFEASLNDIFFARPLNQAGGKKTQLVYWPLISQF
jgi:hypothetical protein